MVSSGRLLQPLKPATASEARYTAAVVALEQSGQTRPALTAYSTLLTRWPGSLAGRMGKGNAAYALHDLVTAEGAATLEAAFLGIARRDETP